MTPAIFATMPGFFGVLVGQQVVQEPTPEQVLAVSRLLGRDARGLEEIMLSSAVGVPQVIRVASLVDNKPFPTLFWLVDPDLSYAIDRLEAGGLIARLQADIDADAELQDRMSADHRDHIDLRNAYMTPVIAERLKALNYYQLLQKRGIGGIADFRRIRCLHTWYAAHLVVPNSVGEMIDHWLSSPGAVV